MSGLLSYLFTYDTDTINLKVTDPSSKTADIKVSKKQLSDISVYFKANADKLYDGYPITLPISNDITRKILESLPIANITATNMIGYRILKDLWQISIIDQIPDEQLLSSLISIEETYENISKYEQLQDLAELLLKNIMQKIEKGQELKLESISIHTLKQLLSRIDYNIEMAEDNLLMLTIKWFEKSKNNSQDQFNECLSLIDMTVIDYETIRAIRNNPIYETFKTLLQPPFLEMFCNGNPERQSQRNSKYEALKVMHQDQLEALKVGEFIDAKRDNIWWRALITAITADAINVTYIELPYSYDESIPKSSRRIAPRNSMRTCGEDDTTKILTLDECKQLKPGDDVDVKNLHNNKWYRANIKTISDSDYIDVLFYGNSRTTIVPIKHKQLARYGTFEAHNTKEYEAHIAHEKHIIPMDEIKNLKFGDIIEYKPNDKYRLCMVVENTEDTLKLTHTGKRNIIKSGHPKDFNKKLSYKGSNISETQIKELEEQDKKFMPIAKINELKIGDIISVRYNQSTWYVSMIFGITPTTIGYTIINSETKRYVNKSAIAASLDTFPISNKDRYEQYLKAKQTPITTIDKFQKGDIIDANDKYGYWYMARIITTSADSITVEFIGYGSSHNETLLKTSGKLAPFRTFTTDDIIAEQERLQPKHLTIEQINELKCHELVEIMHENRWKIAKVVSTSKKFLKLQVSDSDPLECNTYSKHSINIAKLGTHINKSTIEEYTNAEDTKAGIMPLNKINQLKPGTYIEIIDNGWTLAKVLETNAETLKLSVARNDKELVIETIDKKCRKLSELGKHISFGSLQTIEVTLPDF